MRRVSVSRAANSHPASVAQSVPLRPVPQPSLWYPTRADANPTIVGAGLQADSSASPDAG